MRHETKLLFYQIISQDERLRTQLYDHQQRQRRHQNNERGEDSITSMNAAFRLD